MSQEESSKIKTPIQDMVSSTQQDGTIGPMIGSIVIIFIIIVGGLYFFGSLITAKKTQVETEQALEAQNEAVQIEETAKQSKSDDVPSIEADLQATNIDDLDKNLTSELDKEF